MLFFKVFAAVVAVATVLGIAALVFAFKNRASIAKEVAREAAQGDALVTKVTSAVSGAAASVAAAVAPK